MPTDRRLEEQRLATAMLIIARLRGVRLRLAILILWFLSLGTPEL